MKHYFSSINLYSLWISYCSSSLVNFRFPVWISFTDFTIRKLSNADAIRVEDIFLSICKFNCFDSSLFNLLNCAVREDTLFLPIFKDALYCSIREYYFLCFIWEVLFNLVVAEFEHLKLVREGGLGSLCLWKVVYDLSTRESLLDILVVKVDNCVAIREGLALNSVVEDYFLLAVLIDSLNLAILSNVLLNDLLVREWLAVILFRILQTEVFVFVRLCTPCRWHCFGWLFCWLLCPVELNIDWVLHLQLIVFRVLIVLHLVVLLGHGITDSCLLFVASLIATDWRHKILW